MGRPEYRVISFRWVTMMDFLEQYMILINNHYGEADGVILTDEKQRQ